MTDTSVLVINILRKVMNDDAKQFVDDLTVFSRTDCVLYHVCLHTDSYRSTKIYHRRSKWTFSKSLVYIYRMHGSVPSKKRVE